MLKYSCVCSVRRTLNGNIALLLQSNEQSAWLRALVGCAVAFIQQMGHRWGNVWLGTAAGLLCTLWLVAVWDGDQQAWR